MLQQIILSNYQVYSLPEPWLMLPLVYLTKADIDGRSSYNYRFGQINIEELFKRSGSDSLDRFRGRISKLALDTYSDLLPHNKKYFLDKTPRYYHIINELIEFFPNAKFVILVRNPLSVFCSIMDYNFDGALNWLKQNDRWHDIVSAPRNLSQMKDNAKAYFVRYEDIVVNRKQSLKRLFEYLDLNPMDLDYKGKYSLATEFAETHAVDRKSLNLHKEPVGDYLNTWKNSITNWQKKRVIIEYIEFIGRETISELGYSYDELLTEAKSISTRWSPFSLSFNQLSNNYNQGNVKISEVIKIALTRKIHGTRNKI